MILARVTGTLTSEDKDPELRDYKLMVVQPLAIDPSVDGWDLREGNAARQITGRPRVPLQAVIVGVVDRIDRLVEEAANAG